MDHSDYDVVVVGAGPAGSSAARILSRKGFTTLLLDRRSRVGLPVQCGELLPTPFEIQDIFPHSRFIPRLVDVPSEFVTNKTSRTSLVSPDGHPIEFDFNANIIDRAKYDQHLAQQAIDSGCELSLSSFVTSRSSSNIISVKTKSDRRNIIAKIVVGADGANSLISKSLGNSYRDVNRDLSLSLNYVMNGVCCDEELVQMYFGKNIAPGGYAWIIPKGDSLANVGCGIRRSLSNPNVSLTTYLKHFITRNKIASSILKNAKITARVSAIVPMAGPVNHTFSENVVLVGDAAGHVMASNGGGIPQALGGGYIAGHIVSSHLADKINLSSYEKLWRYEFGKELDIGVSILRIADSVMSSDSLSTTCMRIAGRQFLEPLIRCRLPIPIDFVSKTFIRAFNIIVA